MSSTRVSAFETDRRTTASLLCYDRDTRRGVPELTQSDAASFSPPAAFGPFRVLHQIGVGVLGPVFRTYEPARDRLVAVKAFRLDLTPEQSRALADALQELVEASLIHPSVVAPIAAGVEGTLAYLAEEYIAAESLDVALRHIAPAPLEKALPFVAQLAGAIDFARAAGVGHGALHPRDVFVTPDEARATGFGIAGALERIGVRPPVRRPYSAPERVAGRPWGAAADVFALGAIAYELLAGRRLAGAIRGSDPLGSPHVWAAITRALAEDPAERFPSALAFASALEPAEQRSVKTPDALPLVGDIDAERDADLADVTLREEDALVRAAAPDAVLDDVVRDEARTDRSEAGRAEPMLFDLRGAATPGTTGDTADADRLAGMSVAPAPVAIERPRASVLPLALVLVAGLLVGFVAGYAVGTRGVPESPDTAASIATQPPVPAEGTRDWSDQKVAEVPAAPAQPPAEAPAPAADAPRPAEPAVPHPAPLRGTIVVRSTPSSAGVVIDGTWRGRTPLTVDDLPLGAHTVRVVERGYVAQNERVTLTAEQAQRSVSLRLRAEPPRQASARRETPGPQRFTGSIDVDSRPRGARVFIDGKPVGTTPLSVAEVAIGSHVVRLELAGHRPWTDTTRVIAGKTATVRGSLERVP
jgi:serine/threonine-protein kinase